ncbi:radical SAM family heme chaperone HemW [Candidatus Palibaumannia cicadellinicola]|uniref:Heme chaperone HemW n=1 Tax=Candidatus Palibaumannia cicadellinicola TaxID=186490 RepID=A0A088NBA1_9GAMM|nr:radical SAM family heme chaperone HemW [Candidatus Baumannia cicadellinicola]AIN47398.1 putative oxygen-independent coproporphyrinogen III oxidase [Candidatus Baumannia cicadellinicola]
MNKNLPPLSLYIHIPWCIKKCFYCDFNTYLVKLNISYQEYVRHLLIDLEKNIYLSYGRTIKTLFIGGGTPSLLNLCALQQLLDGIYQRLPIASNIETTIEVNPGTIEEKDLINYLQAGVNRLSIGVQSFNLKKLTSLGRIHGPEDANNAALLASTIGLHNFNLDLMHGLPKQTLHEALEDLQQAISLMPAHISWYQLEIEPKTIFGYYPPVLPDDDLLWDIYQNGHQLLIASGYQQYEISAYSHTGYECFHNLNYWRFGDYLGIGSGAHSKITKPDGKVLRIVKTSNPRRYMQGYYLDKLYQVSLRDLPFEYFMNRFRLLEAVPRKEFTKFTNLAESTVRLALDKALTLGYISESNEYWQVTSQGKLYLNLLLELFL